MALCPAEKKRRQNKHRRIVLESGAGTPMIVVITNAADGKIKYTYDEGTTWGEADYYTSAGLSGGHYLTTDARQHPVTGEWYVFRAPTDTGNTAERIIKSSGADLSTATWTDVTPSGGAPFRFGDGHLYNHQSCVMNPVYQTLSGSSYSSSSTYNNSGYYVDSSGSIAYATFSGGMADDPFPFMSSGMPNQPAVHPTTGICLASSARPILEDSSLTKGWSEDGGATWSYDADTASMLGTSGAIYDPFTDRFILFDDGTQELSWVAGANGGHSNAAGNWTNVATGLSGTAANWISFCGYNPFTSDGQLFVCGLQGDIWTSDDTVYNAWSLAFDNVAAGLPALQSGDWDPIGEELYAAGTSGGDGYLLKCDKTDTTLGTWSEVGDRDLTRGYEAVICGNKDL